MSSRGQSLVEFALTMPILLMLVLGVLDAGRGVLAAAALEHAVREGARLGVAAYPEAGWDTQASDRTRASALFLDTAAVSVAVTSETVSGATFLRVSSQYSFRPIAPYITVIRTEIPLTTSTRMLVG